MAATWDDLTVAAVDYAFVRGVDYAAALLAGSTGLNLPECLDLSLLSDANSAELHWLFGRVRHLYLQRILETIWQPNWPVERFEPFWRAYNRLLRLVMAEAGDGPYELELGLSEANICTLLHIILGDAP